MYEITWFRCCKKCDKMKRKYLKQKELNEELMKLVNKLQETQEELIKYIEN